SIVNNVLTVSETAPLDAEIIFKAVGVKDSSDVKIIVTNPIEALALQTNAPQILTHGGSYALVLTPTPSDASTKAVEWVVSNNDYAYVSNGTLFVNANVPHGADLEVYAKSGSVKSEPLKFKVGIALGELELKLNGAINVLNNKSITFTVTKNPTNATNGEYEIEFVQGKDYCILSGNTILVKDDAPIGAEIIFKAVATNIAGVESDDVKIIVGIPANTITISSNAPQILTHGENYSITLTTDPEDATYKNVSWNVSNEDYAYVSNGRLFVSNNVPHGATFTVKAVVDGKDSNELTYKVGVAINSIIVEVSATSVKKGNTATLEVTTNEGATEGYGWSITQGKDYATISNGTLFVKEDVPTGAVISFKAVSASGLVSSDEISIVVAATDMEILQNTFYLVLSFEYADLDKNGKTTPILEAVVYNRLGEEIKDKKVVFELTEGSDAYVSILADGNNCRFTELKAHGTAYLNASIENLGIVEQVELNVIVPPDAVYIPEVFAQNSQFTYTYSMENPLNKEAEKLPYEAYVLTSTACQDIVYTFAHEDGTIGNDVAIYNYENGTIEFLKTGIVTVTASSNSGSRIETKASYKFNINKGFNVYTFEHAYQVAGNKGDYENNKYKGEEINFVALEKIVGWNFENANYDYGYAFVPQVALKSHAEQRGAELGTAIPNTKEGYAALRATIGGVNRIIADTKNLHINGNNVVVNASNLYVPTDTEIANYKTLFNSIWMAHGGIISAEPFSLKTEYGSDKAKASFSVRIYD
ncbi:MAG: Ig-like domain-containing protein, partial [Clostridia bacterium]|nr:Ig-like domain-containing protein [Clostridia bacterium]